MDFFEADINTADLFCYHSNARQVRQLPSKFKRSSLVYLVHQHQRHKQQPLMIHRSLSSSDCSRTKAGRYWQMWVAFGVAIPSRSAMPDLVHDCSDLGIVDKELAILVCVIQIKQYAATQNVDLTVPTAA
jgi:hypothetical protein